MALLDIRQRTGWLFMAIIVGHIVLISAQVNTRRGVPIPFSPVLEDVTVPTERQAFDLARQMVNR